MVRKKTLSGFLAVIIALCAFLPFMGIKASAEELYGIKLADYDDCLTDDEEESLKNIMQETANKIKCNVGIVITADLEGLSDARYSDVFSDNAFGRSGSSVVLMLLNTYDRSEYRNYEDQISTFGNARNMYDSNINALFDRVYSKLERTVNPDDYPGMEHRSDVYKYTDSVQFYAAGAAFCRGLVTYSNPFMGLLQKMLNFVAGAPMIFLIGLIIVIVVTIVVTGNVCRAYKVKAPISASAYIDREHTVVTNKVDDYVREFTTHHTRSSSSGGHGGGHSGGHSGGHGGGGGHHR